MSFKDLIHWASIVRRGGKPTEGEVCPNTQRPWRNADWAALEGFMQRHCDDKVPHVAQSAAAKYRVRSKKAPATLHAGQSTAQPGDTGSPASEAQ